MQISVDFHCHTNASRDSQASPEAVIRFAHMRGLDRLVITDHNTIDGALAARTYDPELVIIGEEIMTTHGEILAAYVSHPIPPGLSPKESIKRLRDQEAFISVSHPFDSWRSGSWQLEYLLDISSQVDAVEVFNARCMVPNSNLRASRFAMNNHVAGTAGSDAHAAFEIGHAWLELPPFTNSDELREVITMGKVRGRQSPFWVHLLSRYASLRKRVV